MAVGCMRKHPDSATRVEQYNVEHDGGRTPKLVQTIKTGLLQDQDLAALCAAGPRKTLQLTWTSFHVHLANLCL